MISLIQLLLYNHFVLVFLHLFVFDLGAHIQDRRTDGRARPVMWPVRMAA